jgi:hypothetical protein
MEFTFGTDPEFMIERWDKLQSAIGLLPKKDSALARSGSKFYYDNVLAEIAVKPAKSKEEAVENIGAALKNLARLVKPSSILLRASAKYPVGQMGDKDAKIAGCNPEWNVYTLKCVLPPEEVIEKTTFRTAGGHIHIGADGLDEPIMAFDVIRMMDLFVGIPSVFMDRDETSKDRRKVYGHAGSHRSTDYGIEYRTLGNFWYASPAHVEVIYDLTRFVLQFVQDGGHKKFWSLNESLLDSDDPSKAYSCNGYDASLLQRAINNCDKKLAEKFMMFISNYIEEDIYDKIDNLSNLSKTNVYEAWGI